MEKDAQSQLETMVEAEKDRAELANLAQSIVEHMQSPLFVMFYPNGMRIGEPQLRYLHLNLTKEGLIKSKPISKLDVLIHTTGGDPTEAYRIAQLIRNVATNVVYLVPQYAYSGGTLITLSGDEVLLGDVAVLSPIDITLEAPSASQDDDQNNRFSEEQEGTRDIELVTIDHFIKVATQARIDVENEFRRRGWHTAKSDVESAMLCEMIKELGVMEIAKIYREKNIANEYARELLRYMFKKSGLDDYRDSKKIQRILRRLVVEAPAHEFPMDYHICKDIGLLVTEMDDWLSASSGQLVDLMIRMDRQGTLFPKDLPEGLKGVLPFFQYFPYTAPPSKSVGENLKGSPEEAENEGRKGDKNLPERTRKVSNFM